MKFNLKKILSVIADIFQFGREEGWWEETPNGRIWRTGKKEDKPVDLT